MNHGADQIKNQNQEEFYIDTFQPQDAEAIVSLCRAVYGDQYPIRIFYDPKAIIQVNALGKYYSIVARTVSGRVIGVTHLFQSAPCPLVYELGVGMVLMEYRKTGAISRLFEYAFNDFIPRMENIEASFGEAVCNHVFTQKAILRSRHVITALEIALMPAEAYGKEKSATGRVAGLNGFRCYKTRPHRVHLPAPYEPDLSWIYSRLDDSREIVISEDMAPSGLSSRIGMEMFDFARVARIAVYEVGEDFSAAFHHIEAEAIAKKAVVLQVWLNLAIPRVGSAVNILREHGYFLGGLLPRWFDTDGLLMQKLLCSPNFDSIVLDADVSKDLLKIIQKDWERAQAFQS
ncbi:MAG: hypothetical protein AB7S77_10770 [Desulfatirhabdiaceae bacterium]